MIEGNQIDDLFEASLNGLQAKPSSSAWDKLSQELDAVDSASVSFDEEASSLMQDFKVQPSNSVWAGINQHLQAAAVAAATFDNSAAESMENISYQPSESVWNNIESELDRIDTAKYETKRRFALWFSVTTTVAASLLFFFMHFSTQDLFKSAKQKNPLVRNTITDNDIFVKTSSSNTTIKTDAIVNSVENTIEEKENNIVVKNTPKAINNNSSNTNVNHNKSSVNIAITTNDTYEKDIEITDDNGNSIKDVVAIEDYSLEKMPSKYIILNEGLSNNDFNNEQYFKLKSLKSAIGFSLDLFAGPELIINTIDQNSSVGDLAILEEVKPVCTDLTLGANLKFHYNKFFIQSGLNYSSYGEQRLFQKNIEMHDTSGGFYNYNINSYITYDTIGWVDDPLQPGGVSPQLSATLHSDTIGQHWNSQDSLYYDFEKYSTKNRYRYIEIPVMLGYKIDYRNWGFSLAAGVSYGFKVAEQGKYLDNGTLKTAFSSTSPYSGFTTNGIVSLGISYNISNRFSVILQPTYKTNLQELNNLSASYQNVSLRMGFNILL